MYIRFYVIIKSAGRPVVDFSCPRSSFFVFHPGNLVVDFNGLLFSLPKRCQNCSPILPHSFGNVPSNTLVPLPIEGLGIDKRYIIERGHKKRIQMRTYYHKTVVRCWIFLIQAKPFKICVPLMTCKKMGTSRNDVGVIIRLIRIINFIKNRMPEPLFVLEPPGDTT